MTRKRKTPANRKKGLVLKDFLPMAQICAKNRDQSRNFNFAGLIEVIEAEETAMGREAALGRLLSEAMAKLLVLYGDCSHVPSSAREQLCVSCEAMELCERIWKELRKQRWMSYTRG